MIELFEAIMLICFGISWPLSGIRNYRARTARNMVTGVGDMFRDAGDAVRNVTGGINDTRQATAGQSNSNQRMGNNARNTMLNVNAE